MNKTTTPKKINWMSLCSIALCACILFAGLYFLRIIRTDGPSMVPTYTPGDTLLCLRSFSEPAPGDVVVIQKDGVLMLKRVLFVAGQEATMEAEEVDVPDETYTLEDGTVVQVVTPATYNVGRDDEAGTNTEYREAWTDSNGETYIGNYCWTSWFYWSEDAAELTTEDYIIPEGYVFVVGDNADESYDSRSKDFGLVPVEDIWGRPIWQISDADAQ